jgi:hypothetical protein
VTGLSKVTLWRRGKLAGFRTEVEEAKPANLTEAFQLVQRWEAEAEAEAGEKVEEKPSKGGRPKADPAEVLIKKLLQSVAALAEMQAVPLKELLRAVSETYGMNVPKPTADLKPEAPKASAGATKKPAKPEPSPEEAELVGLIGEVMKKEREAASASTKPPANGPQGTTPQPTKPAMDSFTAEIMARSYEPGIGSAWIDRAVVEIGLLADPYYKNEGTMRWAASRRLAKATGLHAGSIGTLMQFSAAHGLSDPDIERLLAAAREVFPPRDGTPVPEIEPAPEASVEPAMDSFTPETNATPVTPPAEPKEKPGRRAKRHSPVKPGGRLKAADRRAGKRKTRR